MVEINVDPLNVLATEQKVSTLEIIIQLVYLLYKNHNRRKIVGLPELASFVALLVPK